MIIVVTNQPVIARREVTVDQLNTIHNKMEMLLGREGAYLDAVYYCPHHPDRGFRGEIPELKTDCDCRKPKPGLLFRAAEAFYTLIHSFKGRLGDRNENRILLLLHRHYP